MARQPGLQVDGNIARAKATTNSSPADFAAAWTQAASTGSWKREGKKQRSVGQKRLPRQQQKASKGVAQEDLEPSLGSHCTIDTEDTKDMPLPKWFVQGELDGPSMPVDTIVSDSAAFREARQGRSDQPLKILLPGREFGPTHFNPGMPVKKRVPDWEF
jgi:hypothetical protein